MACIDQYKAAKSYSVLMVMHAGARAKLQQKKPSLGELSGLLFTLLLPLLSPFAMTHQSNIQVVDLFLSPDVARLLFFVTCMHVPS